MKRFATDPRSEDGNGIRRRRQFDVIPRYPRRRWTKVAEVIGGQRSAIWFQDTQTGRWYAAESWKRPEPAAPAQR
jgi:hypothetical protein